MKNKKIIATIAVVMSILSLFIFTGCNKTIEKNFVRHNTRDSICTAAKASAEKQDINNVEIEFYFGTTYDIGDYSNKNFATIAIFVRSGWHEAGVIYQPVVDYKDIPNHYLIKEISIEEFRTDKYRVKYAGKLWSKHKYNHSEKITVPAEVFNQESGEFTVSAILVFSGIGGYDIRTEGNVAFSYKHIEDNSVVLS